jgi:hypothetical protein
LAQRADIFAACLRKGAVVVLCDLRGTGETQPTNEGRGRQSGATNRSATAWMLGETTLAGQVRDLRGVLNYLRGRVEFRNSRIALYGDGLVPANATDKPIAAPFDAADLPSASEPLGAEACLLTALWEDGVAAVYAGGGLVSQAAILDGPYFYVPHDAIVPGLAAKADVADLAAAQLARLWLADLRDGANRPASPAQLQYLILEAKTLSSSSSEPTLPSRRVSSDAGSAEEIAAWLVE